MLYRFLQPLDVLFLRGNRLFGGPGEHAEASMPPWPSVFAGALRSRMLVDRSVDLHEFAGGRDAGDAEVRRVLGTPAQPGSFRIAMATVARRSGAGLETFFAPPADLFIPADTNPPVPALLEPLACDAVAPVVFSRRLDQVPVLRQPGLAKPDTRWWLTERGLDAYLAGTAPAADQLIDRTCLWATDPRLGIALAPDTRTVQIGRLYTSDAVAFRWNTGFVVGVAGADGLLPEGGLVRLGGDGRGAAIETVSVNAVWSRVPQGDRFRVVLSTPGLFPSGWCPVPVEGGGARQLRLDGLEARLVAAAVPRAQVVSGWDLATGRPKPAQRIVPAGAVYWFERVAGELAVLRRLVDEGWWPVLEASGQLAALDDETRDVYAQRRAEGFNNVWLADWTATV